MSGKNHRGINVSVRAADFNSGRNRQTQISEFFTIGVSVRLSDRSLHREEPKKIRQKLLPSGLSQHLVASLNRYGLYKVMLY